MNQFVTILLALVMIMSGLGEAVPVAEPVSCEVSIEVTGEGALKDVFAVDNETGEKLEAIKSMLTGLKFKGAVDNNIQQLQFMMNEKDLFNLYIKKTENELRVISSMMPNTEITIAKETLDSMKTQMNDFNVDTQKLSLFVEEAKKKADELLNNFIEKQGEAEYGSFESYGEKYAEKRAVQTTSKEAAVLFANYVKDIYEDENLNEFVKQLNIRLDKTEFEESYKNLIKMDEDAFPQMKADYYKNSETDDCIVINIEMSEKEKAEVAIIRKDNVKEFYAKTDLSAGYTESSNSGTAGLPSIKTSLPGDSRGYSYGENKSYNMDVHAKQDPENGDFIEFIVHAEKGDIQIFAESASTETGKNITLTVNAMPASEGKNVGIKITAATGKEEPVYNKLEELNEIALEDIINAIQNPDSANNLDDKANEFSNDINEGINDLMTILQQEAPEFLDLLNQNKEP